jgi:hypothetical protein
VTARARPLIFAAANLLAAAVAVWPWLPVGAPAEPARTVTPATDAAPRLPGLAPFATFAETSERPLFSATRRPAPATPMIGIDGRYRLQGLVIAGPTRHALIAPVAGGRALELGEGETVEGWIVTRIERDRVVLSSPAGEATLGLTGAAPDTTKR